MPVTAPLDRCMDLAQNPNFQRRLAVAALDQVATVAGEVVGTTDHANRIAFAAQVAYNPLAWAQKMALGCIVTNANIQTALTSGNSDTNNTAIADADIKTAIGTVWNFYSDAAAVLAPTTVKVI